MNELFYKDAQNKVVALQWKSVSDATERQKTNLLNEVLSGNYVVITMIVPKYMVEGDPNDRA
jgi:hypothetical protein